MSTKRRSPYIWVTHVTGLISGDKNCRWAAWFKAHYTYQKRPDPNQNNLNLWKAEHASLVHAVASEISLTPGRITIEDQNTIRIEGDSATVGGKPDIVVVRDDNDGQVLDCKTGKPRDSDYWQVVTYLALLSLKGERLHGMTLSGTVVYDVNGFGSRYISQSDVDKGRPLVFQTIKEIGGGPEPTRTPSAAECRFCDIACCPDRISTAEDGPVKTEEF